MGGMLSADKIEIFRRKSMLGGWAVLILSSWMEISAEAEN